MDNLFREKLKDWQAHPPETTWKKIASDLRHDNKNKLPRLYRIAALLALFALIGGSLVLMNRFDLMENDKQSVYTSEEEENQAGKKDDTVSEKEKNIKKPSKKQAEEIRTQKSSNIKKARSVSKRAAPEMNRMNIAGSTENLSSEKKQLTAERKTSSDNNTNLNDINQTADARKLAFLEASAIRPAENEKMGERDINDRQIHADIKKLPTDELIAHDELPPHENWQKDIKPWSISGMISPVYTPKSPKEMSVQNTYTNALVESDLMAMTGGIKLSYQQNTRLSVQSGIYYTNMNHHMIRNHRINQGYIEDSPEYPANGLSSIERNAILTNSSELNKDNMNPWYSGDRSDKFDGNPGGPVPSMPNDEQTENKGQPDFQYDDAQELINSMSKTDPAPDHMTGYALINAPDENPWVFKENFRENYHFIEIPLLLTYQIIQKKVDINLSGGINTKFLVDNQSFLNTGQSSITVDQESSFNSFNYSGNIGVIIDYPFASNLYINLQPSLRYYFNDFSTNESLQYKQYSLYMFSGITYQF